MPFSRPALSFCPTPIPLPPSFPTLSLFISISQIPRLTRHHCWTHEYSLCHHQHPEDCEWPLLEIVLCSPEHHPCICSYSKSVCKVIPELNKKASRFLLPVFMSIWPSAEQEYEGKKGILNCCEVLVPSQHPTQMNNISLHSFNTRPPGDGEGLRSLALTNTINKVHYIQNNNSREQEKETLSVIRCWYTVWKCIVVIGIIKCWTSNS